MKFYFEEAAANLYMHELSYGLARSWREVGGRVGGGGRVREGGRGGREGIGDTRCVWEKLQLVRVFWSASLETQENERVSQ